MSDHHKSEVGGSEPINSAKAAKLGLLVLTFNV